MSEDLDINGLKRCPKCKSNAVGCISEYEWNGGRNREYLVACYNCKIHTTWYNTKKEAKDDWNRRN